MSEKPSGIPSYDDMLHELGAENGKLRKQVEVLEAELEKANQLSIKLALQKGGMVDEARTLKAERDRFKQREIELSKGWKRLHSENEDLRSRLAEAEKLLLEVREAEG